jgi:uncharacterized RDD family membrane protein YckC
MRRLYNFAILKSGELKFYMNPEILDNELFEPLKTEMSAPVFAGFWVRVAASLIDTLVFIPVLFISFQNLLSWKLFGVEVLTTFAWMFYKVFMEWKYQATIGKMVTKIKVVNESGGGITLEQSIVRFSFYFLSYMGTLMANYYLFIDPQFLEVQTFADLSAFQESRVDTVGAIANFPMLMSVMFVAFDLRKQALHDKMAKTFCIYN